VRRVLAPVDPDALDQVIGRWLAGQQPPVDHTTNEIARFRPLLDRLDLTDTVVTVDALHTHVSTPSGW
jgi:hypothetical protein